MNQTPHMVSLLGRDAELSALLGALDDARAGRGRLFLLVGEAGIGKTRLADELAARAGEDVRVLWGRCWEAGGAPAYWPWIQALRPLVDERSPAALAEELGPAARPLAAVMPELRQRLPGLPAEDPSEEARFLLFDALARFLRAAAARRPVVLVLDDLHVADRPSLRLLEFVARGLRGSHLLIVGAYRDPDARLDPELTALLAGIEREGQRFPLRRLVPDEVDAFIAELTGAPADRALVDAVVRATEGTPLYVGEVARRALVGDRSLVPEGVLPAIRAHFGRVSGEAGAVLRLGAVIGREFSRALLDSAGVSQPLDAALAEAARAGLIAEREPGRWRFHHVLLRETIYRDLEAGERQRLHARVAAALEAAGDPQRLAELCHHLAAAGPLGDRAKTIRYARQAGERALQTYAHEEAVAQLQLALDTLGPEGGVENDRLRVDLLLLQAEARRRGADRARVRAACTEAADAARRLGDPVRLARVALQLGADFTFGFVDPLLVGLCEEALAGLGDAQPQMRARLMARLAAARQPAADVDAPVALAREAVALARQLGERQTLAAVLRDARAAYLPMDRLEDRLALDLEALTLAYESGDKSAAVQAQLRLAVERAEEGLFPSALGHLDQADRLADELRQPHLRGFSGWIRASIASAQGRFAEADALFDAMEPYVQRSQDPNARLYFWLGRLLHAWTATRDDDVAAILMRLEATMAGGAAPGTRFLLALVRARAADDATLPALADAFPFADVPARFSEQHAMAEMFARAGRRGPCEILYERLLPWAGRFPAAAGVQGSYDHFLGLLAVALGRPEDARRHLEAGVALNERAGLRPWIAHSLIALADVPGTDGAGELRARARAIGEELGMPGLLARLGVASVVPSRPRPEPPLRFDREGAIWSVTFEGASYRFKDSKGMQIVAYLLRNPGREFHVLHLAGVAAGHEGETLIEEPAAAVADEDARASFRDRVDDLRAALAEAEANGDLGRAARARGELEALADELARGVGLGGRGRKTGGSAERARINIQRRISDALARIGEACPPLGRRLARSITTGAYCIYEEG